MTSKDADGEVNMFLNWQPDFVFIPCANILLPLACTDLNNREIVETPGMYTETSYRRFLIPNQPSELGYEMPPSMIIYLEDMDDTDETLQQTRDPGTYISHPTDKDIEM